MTPVAGVYLRDRSTGSFCWWAQSFWCALQTLEKLLALVTSAHETSSSRRFLTFAPS